MVNARPDSRGVNEREFDANARKILQSWRVQTKYLSEAHHEAQVYFKKMSACLTISSLVAGAFTTSTGLFSGGSSAALSENVHWQWNIALGCMGIASTLFVAIDGVFTPGILQASHRECEKAYNKLTREITVQLLADRSSARNETMFSSLWMCLAHFREKLDDLEDQSPPIPASIRARFVTGTGPRRESVASTSTEEDTVTEPDTVARTSPSSLRVSPSRRLRVSFDVKTEDIPTQGPPPIIVVPRDQT
jgi:hypothetical protein